jgi:tripartite-type tricarboxylate transporter receptor subunit TctC
MIHRKTVNKLLGLTLLGVGLGLGFGSHAQDRPPIRILVGFPPGGASDGLARIVAEKLRDQLKQQVIVENRPGVGGRLAAQAVKAAAPTSGTYMIAPNATFVFQHLTFPVKDLGYDMTTDFTSVAQLTSYPMAMIVNASTGVKNARDYATWVKANPDRRTYGTAGAGGDTHFNGLQFGKLAGVELQVVPYRGNGPLVIDLLGGQIMTGIMVAGDAIQHVRAGKLNAVGVFAQNRSPLLPDVPTMAEQGFDTGGGNGWMGMWAPANLPRAELERMQAALKVVLEQPDVKELTISKLLQVAEYRSAAEVDRQLKAELDHWGPIIKASGFKPTP